MAQSNLLVGKSGPLSTAGFTSRMRRRCPPAAGVTEIGQAGHVPRSAQRTGPYVTTPTDAQWISLARAGNAPLSKPFRLSTSMREEFNANH
jgi:hypothetical protein